MVTKTAVVNASPLINLAKIGRLNLLNDIFGKIVVPSAVLGEISGLDISEVVFTTLNIENRVAVQSLLGKLHDGEVEVIVGVQEIKADFAVLDDLDGRKYAMNIGLSVIGTLGILQRAKRLGLIVDLACDIAQLRNLGMYMSDSLVQKILST